MLRFGTLAAAAKMPLPARLREIHGLVARLLKEFSPDAVAVESVFTALNMKTALALAEVRGVVLLAAAQRNIPVHSYAPREVKASVAGYGHATKQQMQLMVRAMLGMTVTPEPSDAADALAVALCHIYSAPARLRLAAATAPALVQPVPSGTSARGRSTGVRQPVTR
jgi:crossover junction endodeoxyribonuclease RuvC